MNRIAAGDASDLEWDAAAVDRGDDAPSADYVDGWNDAATAQAAPLLDALKRALAELDRWRARALIAESEAAAARPVVAAVAAYVSAHSDAAEAAYYALELAVEIYDSTADERAAAIAKLAGDAPA